MKPISALSALLAATAATVLGASTSPPLAEQQQQQQQQQPALRPRLSSTLEQVTDDFGDNASNTRFFIYVPASVAASPAVIVAIHWCSGSAEVYFTSSPYAQLADERGLIVIFPESPYDGGCWDVSSREALTRGGGGDSNSIANMVTYTLDKYNGDPSKVFVTGTSSGGMMTNVMAAAYPDMFAAGIAYSGVPAGCFVSEAGLAAAWNQTCSTGESVTTPEHWAQVARDMAPGYDGARPRMQVYHGSADDVLFPPNYNETVKQWAGVFGLDPDSPDAVAPGTPEAGYTTYAWGGDRLVGVYAAGVGHTVPIHGEEDMKFFGL